MPKKAAATTITLSLKSNYLITGLFPMKMKLRMMMPWGKKLISSI
jgi:hypothetical protein